MCMKIRERKMWITLQCNLNLQNDAEAAREAYSKFLERYPYCYGYWRKYADYEKKKGDPENVQKVSASDILSATRVQKNLFFFWIPYMNYIWLT